MGCLRKHSARKEKKSGAKPGGDRPFGATLAAETHGLRRGSGRAEHPRKWDSHRVAPQRDSYYTVVSLARIPEDWPNSQPKICWADLTI
jgi:hypothetical protein